MWRSKSMSQTVQLGYPWCDVCVCLSVCSLKRKTKKEKKSVQFFLSWHLHQDYFSLEQGFFFGENSMGLLDHLVYFFPYQSCILFNVMEKHPTFLRFLYPLITRKTIKKVGNTKLKLTLQRAAESSLLSETKNGSKIWISRSDNSYLCSFDSKNVGSTCKFFAYLKKWIKLT